MGCLLPVFRDLCSGRDGRHSHTLPIFMNAGLEGKGEVGLIEDQNQKHWNNKEGFNKAGSFIWLCLFFLQVVITKHSTKMAIITMTNKMLINLYWTWNQRQFSYKSHPIIDRQTVHQFSGKWLILLQHKRMRSLKLNTLLSFYPSYTCIYRPM